MKFLFLAEMCNLQRVRPLLRSRILLHECGVLMRRIQVVTRTTVRPEQSLDCRGVFYYGNLYILYGKGKKL